MQIFILKGRMLSDEGDWQNISVHESREAAMAAKVAHRSQAEIDFGFDGPDDEDYGIEEYTLSK